MPSPKITDQPLVSIGLCVFNGERFLRKSIESLLSQEYENFELIISDNASEDRSREICREYLARDPRIQFSANNINTGCRGNGLKVLDLARGKYFMWAGCHDLWHSRFVSSCVEVLEKDPEVVLAYPRTLLVDIDNNTIELMNDRIDTRGLNALERFKKIIWELGYCNMIYGLFRSEILKKLDFSRVPVIGEDNKTLAEISLYGAIAQIPEPLYYRRENLPGETPDQARQRRIAGQRKAGLYYEAIIPFTLLAYAHLEVINESNLNNSGKDYLSKETERCFFEKFTLHILQETESFSRIMQTISFEKLPYQEKLRLFRLTKAVKKFSSDNPPIDNLIDKFSGEIAVSNRPEDSIEKKPDVNLPFISIVIPTYNRARYLKEAINSALAQQYENMEILIVDDGSTDNTQAVISEFTSKKIRYLPKEHSGAPATRNYGVREAKGDFILWLDSDDVLLPDTVTSYVALLKRFPHVDVFYGNVLITDDKLNDKGKIPYEDWFGRNPELLAKLLMGNSLPNPGSMVRRDCFQRVGMFDESFKRAHDYEWWSRLAPVANFKNAQTLVVKWRWHDNNMSSGSVDIDWSYDAKIIHLMLERYPLRDLFPQINFSQLPPQIAEGLAYLQVAQRLLQLKDMAGALKYAKISYKLHPSGQTNEVIQELSELSPSSSDNKRLAASMTELPKNEKVQHNKVNPDIPQAHRHPAKSTSQTSGRPGAPPLPLVSVIVPTYNRPEMLVPTLQSILNQTYKDYEIIVVNDCGLDVANIVGWLNQRQNITYVRHDHNRGLAAARNTGLKLARGKYIAYLDDDDLFYPPHLETLVTFLETTDYRVAYTDAHRAHQVQDKGRYVTTSRDLPYSRDFEQDHLMVTNQFPVLCMMHEKACLEKAGLFDESLTSHEDWDLWIRLSLHYPFSHIKKVTCEFTWRQDGSTMTSQNVGDFIHTLKIIHSRYRKHLKDRPHIKVRQKQFLQKQKEALRLSGPQAEAAVPSSNVGQGMRILLVAHGFPPSKLGGTEIYTYSLAQHLRSCGHEIRVLYPEADGSRPEGAVIEDIYQDLPISRINLHPSKNLIDNFKDEALATAFGCYLDTLQVDLVHFQHFIGLSASLLRACADRHIPAVVTAHDEWLICQQCHLLRQNGQLCQGPETVAGCVHCYLERCPQFPQERIPDLFDQLALRQQYLLKALKLMHSLLVPSRFLQQKLAAAGFQHPRTILSPLGLAPFTPLPWQAQPEVMRFTFLGNMIYVKGVEILIQAFNLAATDRARLDLYGRIADNAYFKNALAQVDPNRHIKYHGSYTSADLPQILAQTDVAIIPSRSENYPLVARECLHAGVPVIASRVGGLPEIIRDGENGLLFTPNDPRDLAAKLNFFLEEPQRLLSFRQRIQPVRTIAEEASQLEQIYQDALKNNTVQVAPSSEYLLQLATEALDREDWPTAEGYLRELIQCYADMLESYLSLSDVLTLQGKHQEAGEVLRAARQVDPESLSLLQRLGLNCRRRGDLSGAMAAFTKAWNRNPGDPEILGHLGATCIDLGLFQEAQGYLKEAVQINPRHIDAWLGLARVAQQLEDQEAFDQACCQAAALNAGHPRLRELTKGRGPGNGGAAPPPAEAVQEGPPSGPERVLSSIIIPVFNNLSLTRQCLESISENTDVPHEIIVVDNGSSDGTRDYLYRLEAAGGVRVITNRTNLGFARASNQGAQAARGDYLVFLNNDTIVQPGWLEEMMACARKDEKIGAVGAKLLYPDDTIQHAGVVFIENKLVLHIYKNFHRDHPAVNKEREFQAVTAACMLIKRDLFFMIGAFDESYRNGLEDVDLCLKLREQSYKIIYNPRAVVYHLESKTTGRNERVKENSQIFRSKWLDKIICDDDKYYEEDDITIEVLDRQGNTDTILAHDHNDNLFWQEAVKYRREGLLGQAEACYLRALKFNPFDPRKGPIAQELADLYETQGKHSQAEPFHRMAATLTPGPAPLKEPEECRRNAEVV